MAKKQRKKVAPVEIRRDFWKKYWPAALILLLLPFALYGLSISFGYVLDDKIVLAENKYVQEGISGIGKIFTTESFTGFLGQQQNLVAGSRYRPLSIATFAVENQLFGQNPSLSHFLNILFYALTGLMIFRLLILWRESWSGNQWFWGVGFIAAILFLFHPIHTEVVANIKSRDEILALLLALSALYFSFRPTKRPKLEMVFAGSIFFLALMAKENAITFLAVVPLAFWIFRGEGLNQSLPKLLPYLIATVLFLIFRYQAIGFFFDSGRPSSSLSLMNNPFLGASTSEKFATISLTLGKYIQLLVFPHPLTHDYYPYQIPIVGWGNIWALASLLLYLGMTVFAIKSLKKRNVAAFCIIYFIATLSIVSNIIFPIGTFMNERFMYMPSVGFVLLIGWLLIEKLPAWLKQAALGKWIPLGIVGIILLGYGWKTLDRVPAWKDALSLNQAAVKVSTNSARANCFMGYSLYQEILNTGDRSSKDSLLQQATYYTDRALKIFPSYTDALTTKAGLLAEEYKTDRDLNKLLDGFYRIQTIRLTPFVDQYLNYLDNRADAATMIAFYEKLGNTLVSMNLRKGNEYLQKARKMGL